MKRQIVLAGMFSLLVGVFVARSAGPETPQVKWKLTTSETRLVGVWQSTFQEGTTVATAEGIVLDGDHEQTQQLEFRSDGSVIWKNAQPSMLKNATTRIGKSDMKCEWFLGPDTIVLVDNRQAWIYPLVALSRSRLVTRGWGDYRRSKRTEYEGLVFWKKVQQKR